MNVLPSRLARQILRSGLSHFRRGAGQGIQRGRRALTRFKEMPSLSPAQTPRLPQLLDALRRHHGPLSPPPAHTAFELVLWEKVAYLASDERRAAVFALLRQRVGLTAQAILAANRTLIVDILETGGMNAAERASHVIATAEMVVAEFDGALETICAGPVGAATKQLKRIHGIADPGAEKILLLTRSHPVLGLDSNGLRVLTRLGYGTVARNYATTYRSATASALAELGGEIDSLIDAHLTLRRHGQTVCRTVNPHCGACVLRQECPTGGP
jgi:endonuclease III